MSKFASAKFWKVDLSGEKKDKLKRNKSPLQLLTIIFGKFGLNSSPCRISGSHEIGFMGWVGAENKTKSTSVGQQLAIKRGKEVTGMLPKCKSNRLLNLRTVSGSQRWRGSWEWTSKDDILFQLCLLIRTEWKTSKSEMSEALVRLWTMSAQANKLAHEI